MPEVPNAIDTARRDSLNVARILITTAIGAIDAGNVEYADATTCAVMRVIDGYEAITQLTEVHGIAREPDKPIPFHPMR